MVEKAFWAGNGVAEWFATDLQEFQSAAWHKSGHPVQMSIKYKVAMDELVPKKLRDAGAGACAWIKPELLMPIYSSWPVDDERGDPGCLHNIWNPYPRDGRRLLSEIERILQEAKPQGDPAYLCQRGNSPENSQIVVCGPEFGLQSRETRRTCPAPASLSFLGTSSSMATLYLIDI